jgi:hypothetical protein
LTSGSNDRHGIPLLQVLAWCEVLAAAMVGYAYCDDIGGASRHVLHGLMQYLSDLF